MSSYIKWEFRSIFKGSKVLLSTIAIVYLLEFIFLKTESTGILAGLVTMAFSIVLILSAFGSFIYGTKRTVETFSKPTFLLESMIPIPASKLLLAKYLIAIIMNIFYAFVFIMGIIIMMAAMEENLVIEMLGDFGKLILEEPINLLRTFLVMIFSSTAFTSIVTLIFCFFKSKFPNGKAINIIAGVLGYFAYGLVISLFVETFMDSSMEYADLLFDGLMIIIIALGYLGTVHLIENKLEIYS